MGVLRDLGLQFAEVPITNPREFAAHVREWWEFRESSGLYYLCHGPREGNPNNMESLEKEYFPKVLEVLPLMTELEMSLLTIHLWFDPRSVKEEVIVFKIDLLKRIIDAAGEAGIAICVENLSEKASDMFEVFRGLPSLNLTLDVGHAQLLTEVNRSYGFIEHLPEKIRHIHLHDNRGGKSSRDDLHLPPGEGIINFKDIFKKLDETGYDRTVTLELKPLEIGRCLASVKRLLLHH